MEVSAVRFSPGEKANLAQQDLACRLTSDPRHIDFLAEDWDRLVQLSEFPDIYATSGFAKAWWRAFGKGRALRLAYVVDACAGTRLVAPFYADEPAPHRWKLIGSFRADYNNLVFAKDDFCSFR